MAHQILYIHPELLKIETKDDGTKDLKYKTEKNDHENILKSLKNDNDCYMKKYQSLNKMKVILIITQILIGSASVVSSSTLSILDPSVDVIIPNSTALLTSLVTNEYKSDLKEDILF